MAEPSAGGSSTQPTHYEVLGLTPGLIDSQHDTPSFIKRAYHRTLLRNHPDKSKANASTPSFTVDRITEAWNVLSSPSQRAEYDSKLRLSRGSTGGLGHEEHFHTGVENVDLDDLDYEEATGCWYRSCRCGNARGYDFNEADLLEAGDDGILMVGCQDCSLWLRVHFAMLDEEAPDNSQEQK